MSRDLYDCTAADLASSPVEHLPLDTTPADAADWLETNGYDAAPVYRDEDPVGFVHVEDVAADDGTVTTPDDDGDTLEPCLTQLTIEHMVDGNAAFPSVVSALVEKPVYFLGGHSHVSGVLTRADLNTSPARIYLFDRIAALEEHLCELILDVAPDWKESPVTADELDAIEDRYADARAANVALEEIRYAQFSTLETIVTSVEDCWQACGFSTKGTASSRLHEVTALRNDVAHANLVVETTDSNEFLNSGRTTENLATALETVQDVLARLGDAGYAPDAR